MDVHLLCLCLVLPAAVFAAVAAAAIAGIYAEHISQGAPADGKTMRAAVRSGLRPAAWRAVSIRYALPSALVLLAASLPFALAPNGLHAARLGACVILLILALIDLRCRLLPDALTLPLLWAGLLTAWVGVGVALHDAVLAAALGYGVLWTMGTVFEAYRGTPGMGGGDMKLLAALGAWVGWQVLAWLLFTACISGLLCVLLGSRGGLWRKTFAFGPHLAGAGAAVLLAPPVVQYFFI